MNTINHRKVKEVGRFIYEDNYGKMYILNKKKENCLMMSGSQIKYFQLFRLRLVIAVLLGFLVNYYTNSLLITLATAIVSFVVLQVLYTLVFLPTLIEVKANNLDDYKVGFLTSIRNGSSSNSLKLFVISFIICGIFIYNYFDLGYSINILKNISDFEDSITTAFYLGMICISGSIGMLSFYYCLKNRKGV